MSESFIRRASCLAATVALLAQPHRSAAAPSKNPDWREISQGLTIPSENYTDQPYIVTCADGSWLCVVTTSLSNEGATSEHVVSSRSEDQGRSWEPVVPLEPQGPPESAYATAVKVPSGRIYAFYDHNTDNVRSLVRVDGTPEPRVDSMGHFVFKYTDDGGRSWSKQRYEIPFRETQVDRENQSKGKYRSFWHVGRPLIHKGAVYVTLHKIGAWPMDHTEGNFLRSDNLLTETDPSKIHWETLPDGDVGLRAPAGTVAEEQSIVDLSDGTMYCTYRTVMGFSCAAYSRDDGHVWTPPAYMTYTPGGQPVKNSRAANFVWNAGDGHYLYWFENNGGRDFKNSRNPAWILGGREVDTPAGKAIAWSQPEILLYGDSSLIRMSYPDFVVRDGHYYVTETQKTIARVHEIPADFFNMLWRQYEAKGVVRRNIVTDLDEAACRPGSTASVPTDFDLTPDSGKGGLTLDVWVRFKDLAAGQVLLDSRDGAGTGFALRTTERGTVELVLRGSTAQGEHGDLDVAQTGWDTDAGLFDDMKWHHVVAIVDNGPKIISFVVDGKFCDGGPSRTVGWARYSSELRDLPTSGTLHVAPSLHGDIRHVRVYDGHLQVSEAISNWRAETDSP
jgi:hypothetical protein